MQVLVDVFLAVALIPSVYYLIAIFSSWQFFKTPDSPSGAVFTPPVSNLKPIRGLDRDDYENFASFCRQDYPDYELLFCVGSDDPAVRILEQLTRDFPQRQIRILVENGNGGANDKVMKLDRLVREAQHDITLINASDVRACVDYLSRVFAPPADPKVGAVTCFYLPLEEKGFTEALQNISMLSDFFASTLVARQLDGV